MSGDAKAPGPSVRDIDMVRVRYVDSDGVQHLVRLEEAADVPFENGRMVRAIPSHRGQGHMPGQYWVAKWGDFVEYESVLESKWLTLLDFDPQVTAFVTQPLEFDAIDAHGAWRHTPDVFARRGYGSVLLLDVKNPEQRDAPKVRLQEERTHRTCERLGWDYAMVSEPSPQRWVNVDLRLLDCQRRIGRLLEGSAMQDVWAAVLPVSLPGTDEVIHQAWDSCLADGRRGQYRPLIVAAAVKIATEFGFGSADDREAGAMERLKARPNWGPSRPRLPVAHGEFQLLASRFGRRCRYDDCGAWVPAGHGAVLNDASGMGIYCHRHADQLTVRAHARECSGPITCADPRVRFLGARLREDVLDSPPASPGRACPVVVRLLAMPPTASAGPTTESAVRASPPAPPSAWPLPRRPASPSAHKIPRTSRKHRASRGPREPSQAPG